MDLETAIAHVRGALADARQAMQVDSSERGFVFRSDLRDVSFATAILALSERLDRLERPESPRIRREEPGSE